MLLLRQLLILSYISNGKAAETDSLTCHQKYYANHKSGKQLCYKKFSRHTDKIKKHHHRHVRKIRKGNTDYVYRNKQNMKANVNRRVWCLASVEGRTQTTPKNTVRKILSKVSISDSMPACICRDDQSRTDFTESVERLNQKITKTCP